MDDYLTRKAAAEAVASIDNFISDMHNVYDSHGVAFGNDVGRKNIIISAAQEHFFAEAIRRNFGDCSSDGRTGKADIVITSLNDHELECKCLAQGKNGSWSLQTDKATLEGKGELDFLYLLYDRTYNNVGVFLFKGLIADDFRDPSPGSRGKAQMRKGSAFKKCIPLIGSFTDRRNFYINKYMQQLSEAKTPGEKRLASEKIELWTSKASQISIELEPLNEFTN
tara:strand:- start:5108 stop:5779 length:672 start_codon:yes stop_codon:yes gene_type:complete